MTTGLLPLMSSISTIVKVKAAIGYDPKKALEYADSHWNDGKEACAGFVSNCIKAGGISSSVAWSRGCTTLINQLKKSGLGSVHEISLKSNMSIKASDYEGKLSPGDIIFYYCGGCSDGKPYIHSVLFAGTDSDGYARCYSHNNANNASKRYYYSKKCYDCGTVIKKAFVFHFDTENNKPEKPKRQYVRIIQDGWYWIETACDKSGNSVLNICGNSMENGGNLIIYPYERTGNELFYIHYEGNGVYSIMSYSSGKFLHIQDNSTENQNVHQWENNTHDNSGWYIIDAGNGYYYLENKNNGGFLDLSNADVTPTNNIWTYYFNGNDSERWKLVPYEDKVKDIVKENKQLVANGAYAIASACDASGTSVLNICGNSADDGADLIIYPWEGTDNEIFDIQYEGNGLYSIKCRHSGKYLHVQDHSTINVNVHQWSGKNHDNALWYIEEAGNGYYYLKCKSNGAYLDLKYADTTPCTTVWGYEGNYSKAQRWYFYKLG